MRHRKPLYLFAAVVFIISSVAAITITAASADTVEITQTASAVTYVSAESRNANFDNSPVLAASHTSYRALLQFTTSLPAGSTVDSATLTINSATASGGVFSAFNVGPFDPTSVTWNNRPTLDSAPLGSTTSPTGSGSQVIPLSGLDVENVTDLAVTYSLPGTIAHLSGLQANAPVLDIVYTPPVSTTTVPGRHHDDHRCGNHHHDRIDHPAEQHLDDQHPFHHDQHDRSIQHHDRRSLREAPATRSS